MKFRIIIFALLLISALSLYGQQFPDRSPELLAKAAYMVESTSGRVLYSKNPDLKWPPASLTKLVTLDIVWQRIEAGKIHLDDIVTISENADYHKQLENSSVMYLEKGHRVTILQLMRGMAVCSANDASIAIAEYVSGSVEKFARIMTQRIHDLGYESMYFDDSCGLSKRNTITAREFTEFCLYYINAHKDAVKELHSLRYIVYPKKENVPKGAPDPEQWERALYSDNNLIGKLEGIKGLKTGYITESSFNFAICGSTDNLSVVAVILGSPGKVNNNGFMNRTLDSTALITYAYNNFTTFAPEPPRFKDMVVWYGKQDDVEIIVGKLSPITLSDRELAEYYTIVDLPEFINAPVRQGQEVGFWSGFTGPTKLFSFPVSATADVKKSGLFAVINDWFKKTF